MSSFSTIFFEDTGILYINNEADWYALHYVFLPAIQKQLDIFQQSWAHHQLRTERNRSPQQLWLLGLCVEGSLNEHDEVVTGLDTVRYVHNNKYGMYIFLYPMHGTYIIIMPRGVIILSMLAKGP